MQLIDHGVDRIIDQRPAGDKSRRKSGQSAFEIMRVNNISAKVSDRLDQFRNEKCIKSKTLPGRADGNLSVCAQSGDPVNDQTIDWDALVSTTDR